MIKRKRKIILQLPIRERKYKLQKKYDKQNNLNNKSLNKRNDQIMKRIWKRPMKIIRNNRMIITKSQMDLMIVMRKSVDQKPVKKCPKV